MNVVGYKEKIHIVICGDDYEFTATMDTGNGGIAPTLGVEDLTVKDDETVSFTVRGKRYNLPQKGEASPTVGNVVHHRPIIQVDEIRIKGISVRDVFLAVTDERHKSTESLMNRDLMSKMGLLVDPSQSYIELDGDTSK